ncbi:MAG TPA: chemoreceptor glutamine deamidase CheD [Burkholderiaceae bacterium]
MKLLPGDYRVDDRDVMLVTILGSCVAACIHDPLAHVGGMNHFMLPASRSARDGDSARYGAYAMEVLINEILKRGGERPRLRAKVFGGAAVLPSLTTSNVGQDNVDFVTAYLATEHIASVASDLGGAWPRRVHFFPATGRAFVKRLPAAQRDPVGAEEARYRQRLGRAPRTGPVELF